MGHQRDPKVTARIEQVVKAWNRGDKTLPQIAVALGVTFSKAHWMLRVPDSADFRFGTASIPESPKRPGSASSWSPHSTVARHKPRSANGSESPEAPSAD